MKKLNMKSLTGFTIMEMMLVLTIMGIILAISVPAFDSMMKTSKVSESAKQVYKTLEFARQHAVTNQVDTMVVFDPVTAANNRMGYKVFAPGTGAGTGTIEDWAFLYKGVTLAPAAMGTPNNIGATNDGSGDGNVYHVTFTSAGIPNTAGSIKLIKDITKPTECFRKISYSNMSGVIRLKNFEQN